MTQASRQSEAASSGETARRPRDRRQQIVAAAADLFAIKGYDAVGIDDIGAAVGVTGPALYRHFRGKDALLVEVVLSSMARIEEALAAAGAGRPDADPAEVLQAGVSTILDNLSGVTTSIREPRRVVEAGGYAQASVKQRRIDHYWRGVLRPLNPNLDRIGVAIRMAAMMGPAVGVALGPVDVPRPRLDVVCAASVRAIMCAQQVRPSGEPPPVSRWRPPSNRSDEILRAAVRQFHARGFAGVGVHEIAAAAGVPIAAVYRDYPGKADILADAYDVAAQRISAAVEQALSRAASARDALERLVSAYVRVVFDDVDLIGTTELELDALQEHERARVVRRRRAVRDRWTDVLREVRPGLAEPEARLLVSMVFPLVNIAVYTPTTPFDRLDDVASVALAHLTEEPASRRNVAT